MRVIGFLLLLLGGVALFVCASVMLTGVCHASEQRSPASHMLLGTIVTANSHELVVSTEGGTRVVLEPRSSAMLRRPVSFTSASIVSSTVRTTELEPMPAAIGAKLLARATEGPRRLAIVGSLVMGIAAAVALGRRLIGVTGAPAAVPLTTQGA